MKIMEGIAFHSKRRITFYHIGHFYQLLECHRKKHLLVCDAWTSCCITNQVDVRQTVGEKEDNHCAARIYRNLLSCCFMATTLSSLWFWTVEFVGKDIPIFPPPNSPPDRNKWVLKQDRWQRERLRYTAYKHSWQKLTHYSPDTQSQVCPLTFKLKPLALTFDLILSKHKDPMASVYPFFPFLWSRWVLD